MRCKVDGVGKLEKLLNLFFAYQRPEIAAFRKAVDQFKTDLPAVLKSLREMIEEAEKVNKGFSKASSEFLKHVKDVINPTLTAADVREMLIQHVLTEELPFVLTTGAAFWYLSATFPLAPGGGAWTATDVNLCQLGLESV